MKEFGRLIPIRNATLQYTPECEMGVVFLFATMAGKLQYRIEKLRAAYPDCVADQHAGDFEKRVRIEFEYRASSFRLHRYDPTLSDCTVGWHRDCPTLPRHPKVIELKRYFGVPVCQLDSPVLLPEMPAHKIVRTASFVRLNKQGRGGLLVSQCWPHLYPMLCRRNAKHRSLLMKYAPVREKEPIVVS